MNTINSLAVTDGQHRRRKIGLIAWVCVGLVVLAVGVALILTTGGSASFGWFAYSPLSEATFSPLFPLMTPQGQIGLTTGISGLLILSFAAGWAFGYKRRSDHG